MYTNSMTSSHSIKRCRPLCVVSQILDLGDLSTAVTGSHAAKLPSHTEITAATTTRTVSRTCGDKLDDLARASTSDAAKQGSIIIEKANVVSMCLEADCPRCCLGLITSGCDVVLSRIKMHCQPSKCAYQNSVILSGVHSVLQKSCRYSNFADMHSVAASVSLQNAK